MKNKAVSAIYDFADVTESAILFYNAWMMVMFGLLKGLAYDVGIPTCIPAISPVTAAACGAAVAIVLFVLRMLREDFSYSKYSAILIGRILLVCGNLAFIAASRVNAWIAGGFFATWGDPWDLGVYAVYVAVYFINRRRSRAVSDES